MQFEDNLCVRLIGRTAKSRMGKRSRTLCKWLRQLEFIGAELASRSETRSTAKKMTKEARRGYSLKDNEI